MSALLAGRRENDYQDSGGRPEHVALVALVSLSFREPARYGH